MKQALHPFSLDIDLTPQMNHPLVQAYIDPDLDLSESHIACIYEAIQYANELVYRENGE